MMETKIRERHDAVTAAWNFFKVHYPPQQSDRYWDEMRAAAGKHEKENPFLFELLIAVQRELMREARKD